MVADKAMVKIYVAGHRGMVGSAIVRTLVQQSQANFVKRTHAELDLTNQAAVQTFFAKEKPDQVYLAAAKVGGIHANNILIFLVVTLRHMGNKTLGLLRADRSQWCGA